MTDEKQGLADRFARWARMGNNGNDAKLTEDREMDGNGAVGTEEQTEVHAGGQHIDLEAGTEGAATEVTDNSQARAELEQARGERDVLKERLARLQAEFDNARKRELKERQDARDYATQAAVEPFLGVMDNFALALKAEGSLEQLRTGVGLIVKQMDEALRGLNVQPVATLGEQFDPHVHEALGSVETPEYPDHQVIEEIRRGYKLREKLLRPALVKIATNSAQTEA
ncbi:MAG: nucleotide exchange factor GrpE [Janthinobacterium lividum]